MTIISARDAGASDKKKPVLLTAHVSTVNLFVATMKISTFINFPIEQLDKY